MQNVCPAYNMLIRPSIQPSIHPLINARVPRHNTQIKPSPAESCVGCHSLGYVLASCACWPNTSSTSLPLYSLPPPLFLSLPPLHFPLSLSRRLHRRRELCQGLAACRVVLTGGAAGCDGALRELPSWPAAPQPVLLGCKKTTSNLGC